jgi:hypothetical protein
MSTATPLAAARSRIGWLVCVIGQALCEFDLKAKKVIIDNHIVIGAWSFMAGCFP